MQRIDLFKDYENAKLNSVEEYRAINKGRTFEYDHLGKQSIDGIPICITRNEKSGLDVTFISDTHLLAIGATRSGKTTGYVIPTLNVLLNKKNKPSIVISDPKKELYNSNAAKFEKQGYKVILLDFTDYHHSDCWNPLTKYYRAYQKYLKILDEVELIETKKGPRNRFRGKIYESQTDLDYDIIDAREEYLDFVEAGITALGNSIIPTLNTKDPFWEDSARDLFRAIIYGMLEDSGENGVITENRFSFDTIIRIFDSFSDSQRGNYDNGYFTSRPLSTSKAHQLARKCIIEQADNTRRCISSSFAAKMNKFRDTCVRKITCTNTFEISELDGDRPTVIFVVYKDEEILHYDIISLFLSNLYTGLIAIAREKGSKLDRPFYFLLDEFGNLPQFKDFDKVISACGGRNIWFLLILQSYAQLYHVYGKETAEIIKDNLNVHVYFGTNNPQTKREFSEECGKKTIIAPTSALNGDGETINRFEKDTVALLPVSVLDKIEPGECVVTQMRSDVLWSRMERSYLCPEFAADKKVRKHDQTVRFADPKYIFTPPVANKDDDDDFF